MKDCIESVDDLELDKFVQYYSSDPQTQVSFSVCLFSPVVSAKFYSFLADFSLPWLNLLLSIGFGAIVNGTACFISSSDVSSLV